MRGEWGRGVWRARQQTSPSWLGFFEGRPKVRSSNVTSAEGPRGIRSISITSVERFVWNYAMLQISGPLRTLIHLIPRQSNLYKFAFFPLLMPQTHQPSGVFKPNPSFDFHRHIFSVNFVNNTKMFVKEVFLYYFVYNNKNETIIIIITIMI